MRVEQWLWREAEGWDTPLPAEKRNDVDLLLLFGATTELDEPEVLDQLLDLFPEAVTLGCSTAGEIHDVRVHDQSLVATAVSFEKTRVAGQCVALSADGAGRKGGRDLAQSLIDDDLVHVFVLSDGLHVNGSELIAGLKESLPQDVTLSGGLASDGREMGHTQVLFGREMGERRIAGVGFYGRHLQVGCGSLGGWDPFGAKRRITRSEGHVLYELDGHSALDLYRKYLGDKADELPASALLFPLSMSLGQDDDGVVRTVLAVDEEAGSMTFAGDMPEGALARFMKANFERLIDGATGAAKISALDQPSSLALLVSCVGRKWVLQQRVEEEVEAVRDVLGESPALTGFYSLGELSPLTPGGRCELHNQTMTITTFAES